VGAVVAVLAAVCGFFVRNTARPGRVRPASEMPAA